MIRARRKELERRASVQDTGRSGLTSDGKAHHYPRSRDFPAGRIGANGAPRRAARLLRGRGDGDQGAGVDGARVRTARVLLPRDRAQPARGRALPRAGRGLRRRRLRSAGRCAADALGARLGARDRRRRPRRGPLRGQRGLPARHQGPPRGASARPQGLHRAVRRARRARRGRRHARGRARSHPARGARRRHRPRARRGRRRRPGGDAGADDPRAERVDRPPRGRPSPGGRRVDGRPQRPLLRDHQSPGRAHRDRSPRRRGRRDRQRELLEHARAREGRSRRRLRHGAPGRRTRRARRRRPGRRTCGGRHCRCECTRRARRGGDRGPRARAGRRARRASPTKTSTSRRRPSCASWCPHSTRSRPSCSAEIRERRKHSAGRSPATARPTRPTCSPASRRSNAGVTASRGPRTPGRTATAASPRVWR